MKALLFLLLLLAVSSCKQTTTPAEIPTGTLKGNIVLVDYNDKPITNKSGVLVQLDGTSFSATTDAAGYWTIENLPSRTYNLTFSKPGFSSIRGQEAFLGGATVWYNDPSYPIYIPQPSRDTVILDGILFGKLWGLYIHSLRKIVKDPAYFLIITGNQPHLDAADAKSYRNYQVRYANALSSPDSLSMVVYVYNTDEIFNGFSSGDTIYFRLYPTTGSFRYSDPDTDLNVYVGIGPGSNELSATMP
jgi:hypothetical protein